MRAPEAPEVPKVLTHTPIQAQKILQWLYYVYVNTCGVGNPQGFHDIVSPTAPLITKLIKDIRENIEFANNVSTRITDDELNYQKSLLRCLYTYAKVIKEQACMDVGGRAHATCTQAPVHSINNIPI